MRDPKEHFELKNMIKSRMLEVAQILEEAEAVEKAEKCWFFAPPKTNKAGHNRGGFNPPKLLPLHHNVTTPRPQQQS